MSIEEPQVYSKEMQEEKDQEIFDGATEAEGAKKEQTRTHLDILGGKDVLAIETSKFTKVFDAFKINRAELNPFTTKDEKEAKKSEAREQVSQKYILKRIEEFSKGGEAILELKKTLAGEQAEKGKRVTDLKKDLDTYKKVMEETIASLETDHEFKSGTGDHRKRFEEETVLKTELLEEEKNTKTKNEDEINIKVEEFESGKEVMRTPFAEKLEKVEISLEKYSSLYESAKHRRMGLESQIKKHTGLLAKLESINSTEASGDIGAELKEAIKENGEKLESFQEAEAKLKERVEVVGAEKKVVEGHLEKIDAVGKTPVEIKKEKEVKRSNQMVENSLKTTLGGEAKYKAFVDTLSDKESDRLGEYMTQAKAGGDSKARRLFSSVDLKGMNAADLKLELSKPLDDFEEEELVLGKDEWAVVLFGKTMGTMADGERKTLLAAMDKMPKKFFSQKHDEAWAISWYQECGKLAVTKGKANLEALKKDASAKIEKRKNTK